MKERERKSLFKRVMSWVLVVCMTVGIIQGLSIAGMLKKAMNVKAADRKLKSGDWLYLDISFDTDNFNSGSPSVWAYWDNGGAAVVQMDKVEGTSYYRTRVTDGMLGSSIILFKRMKTDATENDAKTNWDQNGSVLYNQSADVTFGSANIPSGTNVILINDWSGSGGKMSAAWGSTWVGSSYGGMTMYFYNMDSDTTITDVKAVFGVTGESTSSGEKTLTNDGEKWSITVPDDEDYDNVQFIINGTTEETVVSLSDSGYSSDNNTYYYKSIIDTANGTYVSAWGEEPVTGAVSGTLYFDNTCFSTTGTNSILVSGTAQALEIVDSDTYKCDISANRDSIITFIKGDTKYNFMWRDSAYNYVTFGYGGVAVVQGNYYTGGVKVVYFDATLSKLPYSDSIITAGEHGIPSRTGAICYYATKADGTSPIKGNMIKVPTITTEDNHKYQYVYKAILPSDYTRIAFSNFEMTSESDTGLSGSRTDMLTIDSTLDKPCFYADAGETSVYTSGEKRSGYWAELGNIYDQATQINYVATGTETREESVKYIQTKFYDYFTDLELAGKSVIDYGPTNNASNNPGYGYNNRTYAPNRIFNMALSDYYKTYSIEKPLYFGHFQWNATDGTNFKTIASDMNLYNYDGNSSNSKFLYDNNSQYRMNGTEEDTDVAIQGLVYEELKDGQLQLADNVPAPYFDDDFIEGDNTYNVAFGKVYDNVTFPFTKEGGYWVFNSKKTALRMTKDADNYFLQDVGTSNAVKGYSDNKATDEGNFFPFNSATQSGVVNKLNYGFGMRMDIDFTLTEDGKVGGSPILFKFSGDDDIWIFIDDNLVLDMGGSHGEVDGTLNFATKMATVSKVKTANASTANVSSDFSDALGDNEIHTLTIYYMERGMWESNMSISFNFPETNTFTVDKTVDSDTLNDKIKNNTVVKNNIDKLEFDFDIKDLVTAGPSQTVDAMNEYLSSVGFDIDQTKISDYGSYSTSSAQLKNVDGATYYIGTTKNTVANGVVTLTNGQLAKFTNMFRRGSYLSVTEQSGEMMKGLSGNSSIDISKLFDTTWTIKGYDDTDKNNGSGVSPKDDRAESVYSTVTNAIDSDYLTDKSTILYRNYTNESSVVTPVNIGVSYVNQFKTGSIVISKQQAADNTADLSSDATYTFTVTLDNIAGLHLEDITDASYQVTTDNKIVLDNIVLKKGETSTAITGIPVGTTYYIKEVSSDGSSLAAVKDSSNNTVTFDTNNTITGEVKAEGQETYTFYNSIPQYQVIYYTELSPTDYAAYTGDKKTVTVGGTTKYFKKETTYGPTGAQAGNTVVYDSKDDGTAGVKLNSTAVDASYKKFTGYKYNKTTTEAAGKQSDTVAVNKIATVELYYELTSYKGKYFVESDDQSKEPTAEHIKINGKWYEIAVTGDTYTVEYQKAGETATIVDKKTDSPYSNYTLMSEQPAEYPASATIKEDGTTVVYQIFNKKSAGYTVEYYLQVDKTVYDAEVQKKTNGESYKEVDKVGDKYFVLEENVSKTATAGDTIQYEYVESTGKAGVKLTDAASVTAQVTDTYKEYSGKGYKFNDDTTKTKDKTQATVTADGSAVVKLYYEKIPAQYVVNYFVQVDKATYDAENAKGTVVSKVGDKYFVKKQSSDTYTEWVGDTIEYVAVTDGGVTKAGVKLTKYGTSTANNVGATLKAFDNYEFNAVTTEASGKSSDSVVSGDTAVVELYYEKIPAQYTVEYWVQVDKATYDAEAAVNRDIVSDNGVTKYFVKKTAESVEKSAFVGDEISYDSYKSDSDGKDKAGVTRKEFDKTAAVSVDDTYKSFENYEYKSQTTLLAGKSADTVVAGDTAVVRLYYEKATTYYTEEYYIEVDVKDEVGEYIEGPDGKVYKKVEDNKVTNQEVGTSVTVTDKKGTPPYSEYNLVSVPGYPDNGVVKEDGSTIVYQIYEKIPEYTVQYFKEVTEEEYNKAAESDRNKVGDKFFIKAAEDVKNKAAKDDKVKYTSTNAKTAGVTLNGTDVRSGEGINNTFKSFVGYEFKEDTTKVAEKSEISVVSGGENIVQLYYEKTIIPVETAKYTVKYYKQVDEATYNKAADVDRRKVGDKFFIKATDDVVNVGEIDDAIKYSVKDTRTAGITRNDAAVAGASDEKNTFKSFDNYVFSPVTTVSAGKSSDIVVSGDTAVVELYYEKVPAKYTVEYWLQVDKGTYDAETAGNKKVVTDNGTTKYFIKKSAESIEKSAYVGDKITYDSVKSSGDEKVKAGVSLKEFDKDTAARVEDTFKAFDNYDYNSRTTLLAGNATDTVVEGDTAVVRLYYEKELTHYTEKYYIEVYEKKDGVSYITLTIDGKEKIFEEVETERNVVDGQEAGKEVTVTDKQDKKIFEDYKLLDINIPPYLPTGVVEQDGSTVVYQIYEKKPIYTVEYYVQVEKEEYDQEDEDNRDIVQGDDGEVKYFIKKEIVIKGGEVNDTIDYDYRDDGSAGVKITDNGNTKSVEDTYKEFEYWDFNPDTTEDADKYKDVVNIDGSAKIKLYYENVITKYTEKYYIQLSDEEAANVVVDGENYIELTINGETHIFKKQEQEVIEKQKAGNEVEVHDKQTEDVYTDYELVTVDVDGYPVNGVVAKDGSTIVYQIYRMTSQPEPETTTPEPETTTPQPETTTPEPTTPQPVVSETTTEQITAPQPTTTQPPTTTKDTSKPVKTGDVEDIMVFVLLFASAATIAVVVLSKRKEER